MQIKNQYFTIRDNRTSDNEKIQINQTLIITEAQQPVSLTSRALKCVYLHKITTRPRETG